MLSDGSENLFHLAYGMPQSRTSRRADGIELRKINERSYSFISATFTEYIQIETKIQRHGGWLYGQSRGDC